MSQRRFIISPKALRDLGHIRDVIAADRPKAAAKVLKTIRAAVRRLARRPGIGHPSDELDDPTALVWTVDGTYSVVYDPGPPLEVHRVLGPGMDLRRALK